MRHTNMRVTLFILEACTVVLMLITGIALFSGRSMPPFNIVYPAVISGTTIVLIGLLLVSEVILAGGSSLLAAATVFIRREFALIISMAAGFILADYQIVESIVFSSLSWLQVLYFIVGLGIFVLAAYLRMTEYYGWVMKRRGHRIEIYRAFPSREQHAGSSS